MSYVKDNLMPNEKILFVAQVHPAIFIPSVFMFVMTFAFFILALGNVAVVSKVGSPQPISGTAAMASTYFCLSIPLFLYSILLGMQALIIMITTEFAVTNRRIIAKTGFIRRHTLEMLLPKIESVSVNQNVLGRLLNFGTVTVTGTGGTKESFRAIVGPMGVRKKINHIIEGYMQAYTKFQQQNASAPQAGL